MNKWKPIESAPLSGHGDDTIEILLLDDEDNVRLGQILSHKDEFYRLIVKTDVDFGDSSFAHYWQPDHMPTHWMHKPKGMNEKGK